MKTLGLIAVVFYLVLTAATQLLLGVGGHPLEALARGEARPVLAAAVR